MGASSSKIEWSDLADKCGGPGIRFREELVNLQSKRRNVAQWFPEGSDVKAIVFIVHGLNEHSLCYYRVAHALVNEGYGVYAMDHVGHGHSDGDKGLVRDYHDLVDDLVTFVNSRRHEHDDVPAFVLAHSMGTLATIPALARFEGIRAVAFSGTALFPGPAASSPFGLRCLYPLSRTSFASCVTSCTAAIDPRGPAAPLVVSEITSDPDELEEARRDPRRAKPQVCNVTAREILKLTAVCKAEIPRITLPFLCLHGGEDQIALPSGSQFLFERAGTELSLRRLKIFPGLKHECFHELRPQGPESIALVVQFFNDSLGEDRKDVDENAVALTFVEGETGTPSGL